MSVELRGNSAATMTAGILLMSRARSFGQRLQVSVIGSPDEITPVPGPALVSSAVLASCGVGHRPGNGALVVIPGPAADPLATCLGAEGEGDWFYIDRAGSGRHPATRSFVHLVRHPERAVRERGRELCLALAALGCPPEPGLLDLLFGAPAPHFVRIALSLRAGRAMTGSGNTPLNRYLAESAALPDPIEGLDTLDSLRSAIDQGQLAHLIGRATPHTGRRMQAWFDEMMTHAGRDPALGPVLVGLVDMLGQVASLPAQGMLPGLDAARDRLAVGLGAGLSATGATDANAALAQTFRFLGGRFVDEARYAVALPDAPPPEDRLARWAWFAEATRTAARTADRLWRQVMDPLQ